MLIRKSFISKNETGDLCVVTTELNLRTLDENGKVHANPNNCSRIDEHTHGAGASSNVEYAQMCVLPHRFFSV